MQNDKSEEIHILINSDSIKNQESLKNSEIIQSALEYNSYLINKVIENKNNITQREYDAALERLYNNLSTLTKNVDSYLIKYPLGNNSNGEEVTSFQTNKKSTRSQHLIENKQFTNFHSGLVVEITQDILNDNDDNDENN